MKYPLFYVGFQLKLKRGDKCYWNYAISISTKIRLTFTELLHLDRQTAVLAGSLQRVGLRQQCQLRTVMSVSIANTWPVERQVSRYHSLGPTPSHNKHYMNIPVLSWQRTQRPQMRIRATLHEATSLLMMAAVTSHSAPSSGSCWSNLCCFGYDIDPTHWKTRWERDIERERGGERRRRTWEPLSGGVSGGHVDRTASKRVRQRSPRQRRFTSLAVSILFKNFIFSGAFANQSRHACPSIVRLSVCPVGVAVPALRLPPEEFSLNSTFVTFRKMCRHVAIFIKTGPK